MEKAPETLKAIVAANAEILSEIETLVHNLQEAPPDSSFSETTAGEVLQNFFDNISLMAQTPSRVTTSQKAASATWASFLPALDGLERLQPHGAFLSARMRLYFMTAFLSDRHLLRKFPRDATSASLIYIRDRAAFLLNQDDALLRCLKLIWITSAGREEFDWVFDDYEIFSPSHTEEVNASRRASVSATSPAALAALGGTRGRSYWFRAEGDEAKYERDPSARAWKYDYGVNQYHLVWQEFGSDGPIRENYVYSLIDDFGRKYRRKRVVLRRSRQFILDARKIAARNLMRERCRLGQIAMDCSRLPFELRRMVMKYLELPEMEHPYVQQLDLGEVYRPFPEQLNSCAECKARRSRKVDRVAKRTCPVNSIVVWNLPLRTFMVFHRTDNARWRSGWSLCKTSNCAGHHLDNSWEISDSGGLTTYLEGIVKLRCGADATLKSVGLGPANDPISPTAEEHWRRAKRIFEPERWEEDDELETRMIGLGGLCDAMTHDRNLQGCYYADNGQVAKSIGGIHWIYGRTRSEEQEAVHVFRWNHFWCSNC